jgi:hypothetical protein
MIEAEWKEWITNPVTQEFRTHLKKAKVEAQEAWSNQQFKTEADNQFALGGVFAINQILDLEYDDIQGA